MALISLQDIALAFGGPLLFDGLSLQIEPGERIALLGRNGTGKTTLMKVIAGQIEIDRGRIVRQQGIEVIQLPQEVPDLPGTVFEVVASGLGKRGDLIRDFHNVTHKLHTDQSPELLRELDRLHTELDRIQGWDINNKVEQVLSAMHLDPDAPFAELSGGQKRRALLARAVIVEPDILLLDEPTNHLDIPSIDWLEAFLKEFKGTLVLVTHDRMFMQHLATRIIELDRGKLFSWSCDYPTFLQRKEAALENETTQRAEFDKKLAEEEVWIRRGVKARRTRNEGRVKALERMREEKKAQRSQMGQVRMKAQEAQDSGRLVLKVENLGFGFNRDTWLVRNFSTQIMRGDKIGVIGPNGSGKTTLLRLLLGQLTPTQGQVKFGTNLEIAYFDQLRAQLDGEKTVIQNICGANDSVVINGKPRHIIGYLNDFLFSAERARTPVKVLSGGERNRLLLAKLFTKPSNVLVMDEPTNDLDIETLELLEELLLEYSGTLLLVSHDRSFLNNVVTSTIVLEGDGVVNEYAGGYDDWVKLRPQGKAFALGAPRANAEEAHKEESEPQPVIHARRLSHKEEQELAALPGKIEKLEKDQDDLYALMAEPEFYKKPQADIDRTKARLSDVEDKLLRAFQRWELLEGLKQP